MEENNTLLTQIEDLVSHEDLGGLEQLIQSLNTEDLQKYKTFTISANHWLDRPKTFILIE